ncbi:MAG: NAD(P)-dependent oxidoreductase [Myxococcales bacterium]|nr:NAD(P)-dependent oxidoreductase [Myxococcales bacterium]
MPNVAVIGAGLLGAGFVEHLLEQGVGVRVWNRTPSKLGPLAARGAVAAATPADAVRGVDRVHVVVAEDDAVDAVIQQFKGSLPKAVPIFDHTTNLPARVASRFTALRAEGFRYVPAPVFMAPANARAGTGLMLMSGPQVDADDYTEILLTMSGRLWYCGGRAELAAVYKLMGNSLIVGMSGVLSDALQIGAGAGLGGAELLTLLEHFNPGGMLPAFASRIERSATGDASFTLEMARKDVRLMIETASATAGPLFVLPGVAAGMDAALHDGHAAKDYAIFARKG